MIDRDENKHLQKVLIKHVRNELFLKTLVKKVKV